VQLGDCGRLFAIKEAAGILGVSRDSVGRLLNNGELECFDFPKMGGAGKNRKRMATERGIIRFMERGTLKQKRIA
jgi:transposase